MGLFKDFEKKRKFSIAPIKIPNPPKKLQNREVQNEGQQIETKEPENEQKNLIDDPTKCKENEETKKEEKTENNPTKEDNKKDAESSNDEDIDLI